MNKRVCGSSVKISGPLIVASGMKEADMFDLVRVGSERLIGEIIEMHGECASIQVYEDTSGIGCGEKVESGGGPLSVELGPGLLGNIYDGIQRPLEKLRSAFGAEMKRGAEIKALDRNKKWFFSAIKNVGETVVSGDFIGTVRENAIFEHKISVPVGMSGRISEIKSGEYGVDECVAKVKTEKGEMLELTLMQKWPVRIPRPYKEKILPSKPMVTGQRVIDLMFPIAMGGTACIPGAFGSGKTVLQHQIAKFSDADIVVYIGCGERGNEMTDVQREFPELKDPKTGASLMQKTVLIANTSDMPVAAREASIYTGITIAEYFRDMGLSVVVIADSSSRWAEALREMSARLGEMPGDEGYPAYLASRIAGFYERSGCVKCLGLGEREGSLTVIGAVSPPGGDLSEPVTQATLKVVKVFWGLDASLAYRRHFPAVNWLRSYSLYRERLDTWFSDNVDENWGTNRAEASSILQKENELSEIVKLVGSDALSLEDRLIMETARSVREDFLQQNARDDTDKYTPLDKQSALLELVLYFHRKANLALKNGADIDRVASLGVRESIGRAKYVSNESFKAEYEEIKEEINRCLEECVKNASGEHNDFRI